MQQFTANEFCSQKDVTEMPIDANLTKNRLWGLRMLGGFSDALRGNRLAGFLQSDELERFLHDSTGGSVAGKTPGDGTPGSKLPGIGLKDPLNVLHGLFEG